MGASHSRFAGETILITDDDEVIVRLAILLLQKRGFEVVSATDGEECLRQVEAFRPALVLLDYMLPKMNGLEVLKSIQQNYPDTSVVMFTGKGSEEVAVAAMKAGAADYLQKPFASQRLQERIDTVLALRQVELENRALTLEKLRLQQEIEAWNAELEQRVKSKSMELEDAHQEIVQAEKLATLGHVSAGMAHEIRNPLNSINLFAEILLSADDLDAENRNYVEKIVAEVERIDSILLQMRAASHGSANSQQVYLKEIIDNVLESTQSLIKAQHIDVNLAVAEPLPPLQADGTELQQVLNNLIGNALEEMPTGGILEISAHADEKTVFISVSDSGSGIPEQHLQRIFEPFFTTKEKGTGFGLSVVRRIVNNYRGCISVENSSTGGACFHVELPLLPEATH